MQKFVKYLVCVAVVTLSLLISSEGQGVMCVGKASQQSGATLASINHNYYLSAGVDNLFSNIFLRRISAPDFSSSTRQLPQITGICGAFQVNNLGKGKLSHYPNYVDIGSSKSHIVSLRQLRI